MEKANKKLKLFVCDEFKGVYLPGQLIVVARDQERARILAKRKLGREHRLLFKAPGGKPAKLKEVSLVKEGCLVLFDGDY